MTVVFDKLRFSKRLEADSAFDRRQAEALTEAMHDAVTEGVATQQSLDSAVVALRREIAESAASLRLEIAALRLEMAEIRTELRTGHADLRAEMRRVEAVMMRWTVTVVGLALAIVGAFRFFLH